MEFTQKQFKTLCDTYINDQEIIITGCNFLAQEYTTTGKLAKVESEELAAGPQKHKYAIGITPDKLILEFGKKSHEDQIRADYSASFVTDLYEDDMYNFVIKDITLKKTKQVIYENKDYAATREWCVGTLIQYNKELMRNNITPADLDDQARKLKHFVGRPINIFGQTGVLFLVDSHHKGETLLYLLDFTELKEIKIPRNVKITEGKNLIKITQGEKRETFQDYLLNQRKKNNTI